MISPPIMIRGETLILQVVVFNYMNIDLENLDITFLQTESFSKFVLNESIIEPLSQDITYRIPVIKSQTVKSVSFAISAVSVGQQLLSVRANSSIVADAEQKSIIVKPEGINQIGNIPMLIDMRTVNTYISSVAIKFPQNIVENSEECSVQIIGDLLGQAFNNLGNYLNIQKLNVEVSILINN